MTDATQEWAKYVENTARKIARPLFKKLKILIAEKRKILQIIFGI